LIKANRILNFESNDYNYILQEAFDSFNQHLQRENDFNDLHLQKFQTNETNFVQDNNFLSNQRERVVTPTQILDDVSDDDISISSETTAPSSEDKKRSKKKKKIIIPSLINKSTKKRNISNSFIVDSKIRADTKFKRRCGITK
jgi:hypothetical protein